MTIQELIEKLEGIEDLDIVEIHKDKHVHIYDRDGIEFIDERILCWIVKKYLKYPYKDDRGHEFNIVRIEC